MRSPRILIYIEPPNFPAMQSISLTNSPSLPQQGVPIVVAGMHRSGTSVLMHCCELLGVHVGQRLLGPREDNPKGFWEHAEVVAINEQVFRTFNLNSQDVLPFPHHWHTHQTVVDLVARLEAVLRNDLVGQRIWGIKDPRICRVFPIWEILFQRLATMPMFLIPVRHPVEVCLSLAKRDFISMPRGMLLWMQYNLDIEFFTRGYPRAFVSFDRIFSDPVEMLVEAEKRLDIAFPVSAASLGEHLQAFVAPQLRHHRQALTPSAWMPEMASALWNQLCQLERSGVSQEDRLDRLRGDLWSWMEPCAETLYAMKPPTGIWRQTLDAKCREIEQLRTQLSRLKTPTSEQL